MIQARRKGPLKLGRFALKSLDIANFMRMSAQFANPAQPPSPELIAGLFPLIEGVEIKGVTAPFKNTGKFVNLDGFDLNWGQFVGPDPEQGAPDRENDHAGRCDRSFHESARSRPGWIRCRPMADIGAAWTEAARSFVVDVPKLEIGGLLKASARVALANVPRQVFSANAAQAMGAAAQIEAGTIELTVRDLGGVDLGVAQYARTQNVSRDAARQSDRREHHGQQHRTWRPPIPMPRRPCRRWRALSRRPGQTLIIKLTPRAKVPALQLVQLLKTDPLIALAQFRIEASTGL